MYKMATVGGGGGVEDFFGNIRKVIESARSPFASRLRGGGGVLPRSLVNGAKRVNSPVWYSSVRGFAVWMICAPPSLLYDVAYLLYFIAQRAVFTRCTLTCLGFDFWKTCENSSDRPT